MALRSAWLGLRSGDGSGAPVTGLSRDSLSQRVMCSRSYEWPSAQLTGSRMSSRPIGQQKDGGADASRSRAARLSESMRAVTSSWRAHG